MASKRAIRRKACGRKRRYESHADAAQAIGRLNRDKGYQGLMAPYRCAHCGGWHFGHPPARIRRAIDGGARPK